MKGHVGDRIIVRGPHAGDRDRIGTITELRHDDGSPPFVVQWLDNDHEGLLFPGPDTLIETREPTDH